LEILPATHSRRISERLDGRDSAKISDNYEIDENDFEESESGNFESS